MSTNLESMIKDGIRLFKAGKKAEARAAWEKVTELDQYNEQAWLWLSAVVENPEEQRTCLENVLFINPNNANAQKGLETLKKSEEQSAVPPSTPAATGYSAPPTATSSASSTFVPDETPPEVYDNWIDSLNIGSGPSPSSSSSSAASSNVFDDDVFSDTSFDSFNFETDDDDDLLHSPVSPFTTSPGDDLRAFMAADEDEDEIDFDDPFGDDPFAEPSMNSGPFSVDLDDDDIFSSPPAAPNRKPAASARPQSSAASKPASGGSSRFFIGDDAKPMDEPDPSEYFALIPAEIKTTRLPGTSEKRPMLVQLLLVLLIIANIGAAGLLIARMAGVVG